MLDECATKGMDRLPVASGGMSRLAYRRALIAGIDPEGQLQKAGIGNHLVVVAEVKEPVHDRIEVGVLLKDRGQILPGDGF